MVRVALQRDYTNDEKATIKKRLLAFGARDVRWMELKQKLEEDEVDSEAASELHQDLFTAWIDKDSKGMKGLDAKVLKRCNAEVVHEGDELYAVEAMEV